MNKTELIRKIAENAEIPKANAQKCLDAIIDSISEELSREGKVSLVGFGTFYVSHRQARKGRNPQTGEEILIDESKTPKFKPGKNLKESVS